MNDETNGRERGKKKKQCAEVATYASSSILVLYVVGNPSGSMIPTWGDTSRLPNRGANTKSKKAANWKRSGKNNKITD